MNAAVKSSRPEKLLDFGFSKKLPVILQSELAECGMACLAMISCYYGFETDLSRMRARFPISGHGLSLRNIIAFSHQMNLAARPLRLDPKDLNRLSKPCILHWGMDHFVVLKSVGKNKIVIHDPAVGEVELDYQELNRKFTGVALELVPTDGFKVGGDSKKLPLGYFWRNARGIKRSLAFIIVLSLLLQIFSIVSPLFNQIVVDDVIQRGDQSLLIVLALGFFILLVVESATSVARRLLILNLSSRLSIQMAVNLLRHLLHLPLGYFAKRHMGDVVSRFSSMGSIRELLTTGVVTAVVDGALGVITLCAMLFYDVKLTLVVVLVVIIYAIFRWCFYRPIKLLNTSLLTASAKQQSHFMESVRAISTVKLFQREEDRLQRWQNLLAGSINKNIKLGMWDIAFETGNKLIFGLENIVIIYLAAQSVVAGNISLGMFFAFMTYKFRFSTAMDGLVGQWIELKMLDVHLDRLSDVVFCKPEKHHLSKYEISIQPLQDFNSNVDITGSIEVKDLSYQYGQGDGFAFSGVSLKIFRGETVGIVGPSGCGKTTLLKCMMGLFEPTNGQILIDSVPIGNVDAYRCQIAGVLQDDELFSGTIAENISCFELNYDIDKVIKYAKLASIHEEINSFPMKYNTLIGDMGDGLSGGQKQRVILARALYRQPKILFLDESTSHLDAKNEAIVNDNICALNITRIIVAHRKETIDSCDRVINMTDVSSHWQVQ